tara:strand:+ start:15781 stop:16305 length:525 start_codon:yes stop_codon:yes gene_type:complete
MKEKIAVPQIEQHKEVKGLLYGGFAIINDTKVNITDKGRKLMVKYDNHFTLAKKKTNLQLMGKDFLNNIEKYRELFPAKKLPSGKLARVNIKTLTNGFTWFFGEYDYTWQEVLKATAQYVNEYEDNDYMYMKTSQYFITKEDKSKTKHSELADYCDMVREGIDPGDSHFKEKVV